MGLVLLIVIWLITVISTYFFVAKTWWLSTGVTAAAGIDHHFTTTYILMGAVPAAAQLALDFYGSFAIAAHLLPKRQATPTATTRWKFSGRC